MCTRLTCRSLPASRFTAPSTFVIPQPTPSTRYFSYHRLCKQQHLRPRSIFPVIRYLRSPSIHSPQAHRLHTQASSIWTLSLSAIIVCGGLTLSHLYTRDPTLPTTTSITLPEKFPAEELQDSTSSHLPAMAEVEHTGYVGNLTREEEAKLKEFWGVLLKVFGVVKNDTAILNGTPANDTTTGVTDSKKSKKRMGFFRKKSDTVEPESSSDALATTAANLKISDSDDKYGQTREFYDALANLSPDDLRLAFWSMVKADHPDALVLRFLRARKWDVNRALVMLISAIRWRSQVMHLDDNIMLEGDSGMEKYSKGDNPEEKLLADDFLKLLHIGESFIHGIDKRGRPICYIRVRLHKTGAHCEQSLERYTVYLIETSRLLLQKPIETAALVFDMTDFSLANMDYAPVKFMIKCFEANYPESLGVILVHKAPWLFSSIWTVIKGWLDPVVASKVNFTKTTEDLEQYITRNNILKELGGDDDYDYKYIEPVADENVKQQDTATRDSLILERVQQVTRFQDATLDWITPRPPSGDISATAATRLSLATDLRANYWQLDPYIRAKSYYDRIGVLPPVQKEIHSAAASTTRSSLSKHSSEIITTQAVPADDKIGVVS
ncbi:hypothetical protein FQN57_004494 [Myotisia sp. PD_48]|nr:hypothetical protein FQN57_004494 [Myotisia sp. PD_48]